MLLHRGLWGTSLRECSMMKPTKKTISENSATVIDKIFTGQDVIQKDE